MAVVSVRLLRSDPNSVVACRDDDKLEIRLSCGWITGFIFAQNVLVITSLRTGFRNARIPSVPFSFVM